MRCSVCDVNHKGPCPMWRPACPATRPLQQLTRWLPATSTETERETMIGTRPIIPEPPTPQEFMQLASPMMAPSLRDFALLVYKNPAIMWGSQEGLAHQIYQLYASSERTAGVKPQDEEAKQFLLHLWSMRKVIGGMDEAYFQGCEEPGEPKKTLAEFAESCEYGLAIPDRWLNAFLYFEMGGPGRCRLYLNVKLDSIPKILTELWSYIKQHPDHGVTSFKIAGPYAAPLRADTMVAWCITKERAERLGNHLLRFEGCYRTQAPGLTARLHPHLGVAIGVEPEQQATGMMAGKGADVARQSFGTIRSELIAMAIVNFRVYINIHPAGFDLFARCVCTAFRGYGLDPMNPED